jgi:hypothetical protein
MFKLGGREKDIKAKRLGFGGGKMGKGCMGKGSGGAHHYVDGKCEHCGVALNEPVVNTRTNAGPNESADRGGKHDIKYPHERE